MEEWKTINDYESLYVINKNGDIKTTKRQGTNERILKPCVGKNGYKAVSLCKNGKQTTYTIHSLLGKHFLENKDKDNNIIIDHIDRNRLNNELSNLRWASYSLNSENKNCNGCISKTIERYKETIYTYYRVSYRKIKSGKRFKTEEEAVIYLNELISNQPREDV